ncbi:cytochrome c oxidase assembly protein [Microbacterium sp. GXF7504]
MPTVAARGADAPPAAAGRDVLRVAGPVILLIAALIALVAALVVGGGAAPLAIADAGPVVRWGLPVAKLVVNLAAAVMVGSLVTALYALRQGDRPFDVALDLASLGAAVFTVASACNGFLTFVNVMNATPSADSLFGEQLGRFLMETELGRTWLITTVAGATITVLTFVARSWTATLLVAVLAIASLVPMGTQGHSGELSSHNAATASLVLHIIAAAVWLGGLLLLVVIRPLLTRTALVDVLLRYSSIALVAFVVVAVSGTVRAAVAVVSWDNLVTPYGAVLAVKVVALLGLGVLGAWYRTRLIRAIADKDAAGRRFWLLVLFELALMGVASGAAAALARTAPPASETAADLSDPAVYLTNGPVPPELVPTSWFTAWDFDLIWVFVVAFGLFFYLAGVWRLRRRGDTWPVYRTVLWVLGMLLLLWVTCGPVNAYQDYLFSVHMLGHMLLNMGVPVLLVPAAPITLALRAIRKRDDGTRGGREWIMWAIHTPFGKVVTHPLFAAAMFIGSLWLFYYSDLFRWSLYDHLGHEWMTVHFLISGYLFVLSLIGIDPIPYRFPYPLRLVTLVAVIAMHAFFGIAIMMQTGLFVAEWYGSMGRTWGATPLEDQYVGGGIAWSVGEIPSVILGITVAIQWSRSDDRIQRRRDRHADRTGDAELEAYNARLAQLAERDARATR